jgi:hypothetical protein
VNWSLKKQKYIVLLFAEIEYIILIIADQEAIYLKQIINIFLFEKFIHSSIIIMENNQSAIKIRYINIRYHFIR